MHAIIDTGTLKIGKIEKYKEYWKILFNFSIIFRTIRFDTFVLYSFTLPICVLCL